MLCAIGLRHLSICILKKFETKKKIMGTEIEIPVMEQLPKSLVSSHHKTRPKHMAHPHRLYLDI